MEYVILTLKIAGALVVVVVAAGIALRVRKLRRDEMRELSRPVERRLMAPPPSPYAPSKGFRLLDSDGAPLDRPAIERPRLDPTRHYVFNELSGANEEVVASHLRHNDDWFLSRSAHRSTLSIVLRRLTVLVLILLIAAVLATYYVEHHDKAKPKGAPPSTTSVVTTTTTPVALSPISSSGDDATYSVPLARYRVTVSVAQGSTGAIYSMGPTDTLEWQGTVASGHNESLVMTGNSRVTLNSPSSASVVVEGRPVAFPSPLPPTLLLVFRSSPRTTAP